MHLYLIFGLDRVLKCSRNYLVLVLPCGDEPPQAPEGGNRFYQFDLVDYQCPEGYEFIGGHYPNFTVNCDIRKKWVPSTVPECIRKLKT